MAVFGYRRFYSLYEWFLRKVIFLWRFFAPGLYSVFGYVRKRLTWRKSPRGRQDHEPEKWHCEAAVGGPEVGPEGWEKDPREVSTYE